MKNAAAISAQLVDIRNVGAHKSLKLTLHVPEEQALKAIEAFGWPTGVNPVPVALARLVNPAEESAHRPPPARPEPLRRGEGPPSAIPACAAEAAATAGRRPEKMGAARNKLAQRIGILCSEPLFQNFIYREYGASPAGVAQFVRDHCGVKSRSEIIWGTPAAERWEEIYSRYIAWRDEPDLAGVAQ